MLIEEELQLKDQMLNGRQLAWLVFQNYQRSDVEVGMTDFKDLMSVELKNDNLVAFLTEWDTCILGMKKVPEEETLESLFVTQVRKCKHFEQVFALYNMKVVHEGHEKSYDSLRSFVTTHIEERHRSKISEQASRPKGTGAAASASRGACPSMQNGQRKKGDCRN